MNQVQNEKSKTAVIKSLAIVGFIATIILAVWLSVQVIRVIPGAFSSLASIADSVSNYSDNDAAFLTVATGKSIVNAGESTTISWTPVEEEGSFVFAYNCTEGVSLELRSEGRVITPECGVPLDLGGDITTIDVIVSSERRRFVDVPFTLSFVNADGERLATQNNKFTIVNAAIPQSSDLALDTLEPNDENDTAPVVEDTEDQTEEETTNVPASNPTTPVAGTPTTREETVTFFPQSFEDGFTDLKVTYLGVGIINGTQYEPKASIDNDERGALRFEVKNIGTKTSDDWTFDATLPNGTDFTSDEQAPLRPNERAVMTIGFDLDRNETGVEKITVTVNADGDTKSSNDSFNWNVTVSE